MKLSEKNKADIIDRVANQGDGESWAMSAFDLELEEVEEIMEDANYERCPDCGHWVEAGELADDDCEPRPCYNCKPRGDDE
jgi:hypothetical protein